MQENKTITPADLHQLLLQLIGKKAWRSRAGEGTGSIFTLEFGAALPDDATQGELSLMVYCAWRVTEQDKILLSWQDDSAQVIAPGLAALMGLSVADITLSAWRDLTISFTNGRNLQIMNDFSPHKDFDTSWFISYGSKGYHVVKPIGQIELHTT
ncbi:hypothetical protein GCM10027422_19280 [Hymenobacter arcticus]